MRQYCPPTQSISERGPVSATDTAYAVVLAAGTSKVVSLPAGAAFVRVSAMADVWAKFGTSGVTAAVPSADVTDGSAPVRNPDLRRVPSGATHLALVAEAACKASLEFWAD